MSCFLNGEHTHTVRTPPALQDAPKGLLRAGGDVESWIDIQQAGDGRRGAAVMAAAAAALAARAARG